MYCFPDQWLEVDEANREQFSQKLVFEGVEVKGAKTVVRELTDEEKKALEEKGKKGKKPDKQVFVNISYL